MSSFLISDLSKALIKQKCYFKLVRFEDILYMIAGTIFFLESTLTFNYKTFLNLYSKYFPFIN
jgi:hypothetical protein